MFNVENFNEVLKEIATEKREVEYEKGAIGITRLLYCPIKADLSRKFQIPIKAAAITRGFVFETAAKKAVKKLLPDWEIKEEPSLKKELEIAGETLKINGHPDLVALKEKECRIIEIKSVNSLSLTKEPKEDFLKLKESEVFLPPYYLLQIRAQMALAKENFGVEDVSAYFLVEGLFEGGGKKRFGYALIEVESPPLTQEEISEIGRKFLKEPAPRWHWECLFCPFGPNGERICEGKEVVPLLPNDKENAKIDPKKLSALRYLTARREVLSKELKEVENQIKALLKEPLVLNGKTYGWEEREALSFPNLIEISKVLKANGDTIAPYLQVKGAKTKELAEKLVSYGRQDLIEKKTRKTFNFPSLKDLI